MKAFPRPLSLFGLFLLATFCWRPAAYAAARPPNIVFILADDLGHGHLGCYGQQKIQTPHIDRLAAEGLRFTRAYAGANVCAPSRSTLLTGLHTGHTPVRNNGKKRHLYDTDITFAEILKPAGYAVGGFGKWGLGNTDTPGVAYRQGFDEWFGQYNQTHAHFYYPYWAWHTDRQHPLPGNESNQRRQYVFDETHTKALDFIRRHADRPFLAYLPYIIPHVELVVPEDSELPYRGKFPKELIKDSRPGYISAEDGYVTFAGMVSRLDRAVGEVMSLLKQLKLEENTIVFFTSDNGAQGGGDWNKLISFFDGTGGLRASKGHWYEGGIRTPLIARWPGKIRAGTTSDHVCAFWDMLPTFAGLAGVKPPPGIDGLSILPTLLGQGTQARHEYLYWEAPVPKGLTQAVRLNDWKAVRPTPGGPVELYDLASDPTEKRNVATSQPEVMQRMTDILARARTPERDYPNEDQPATIKDFVR